MAVVVAANLRASQAPPSVREQTRFSAGIKGSPTLMKRLPTWRYARRSVTTMLTVSGDAEITSVASKTCKMAPKIHAFEIKEGRRNSLAHVAGTPLKALSKGKVKLEPLALKSAMKTGMM